MGISRNTEIQQVADRLVSTTCRDHSLQCQTPEYLGYLKIKEVRRVQSFVTRINSPFNALTCGCLEKPVNCGRRIEDDHRASRSSRTSSPRTQRCLGRPVATITSASSSVSFLCSCGLCNGSSVVVTGVLNAAVPPGIGASGLTNVMA